MLPIRMQRHATSQTPAIGPYKGLGSHCNLCICIGEPPHYASYHPITRRLPLNLVSARALAQCSQYKCKGMPPARHLSLDLTKGWEATATFAVFCWGASPLCILPPHHETATSEFGKCKSTCPVLPIQMQRHGTSQTPSIGPYKGLGSHCNLCICIGEPPHYASYHPITRRLPLNMVSARALAQCSQYECKGMPPAKHLPLDLTKGWEATATFAFVLGSLPTMHLTTPSRDGYL